MAAAEPTPLERLYASHASALRRFLTRMLGCEEAAADAAQESFLRLLRLAPWERMENSRAYLFQTAANVARDRLARERGREGEREAGTLPRAARAGGPDAEHVAEARARLRVLADAIEHLPPRRREAFCLSRFDGLGNAEIAERLGISRNMVEKHIIKALLECRRRLDAAGH